MVAGQYVVTVPFAGTAFTSQPRVTASAWIAFDLVPDHIGRNCSITNVTVSAAYDSVDLTLVYADTGASLVPQAEVCLSVLAVE